jgi:hypothetical protein
MSLGRSLAPYSPIYATIKKQLIMSNLQHIFYDFVGNVVFDTYGKIYEVKESKGWKFVNVGKDKVSVSKLQKKFLIRNFDDFTARYALYFCANYRCLAMEYFVYRKVTGKQVTVKEFFKTRK